MDLQLRDKVIYVAGASDGLGLAIAECLVAEGACVLLGARDTVKLDKVVANLQTEGKQRVFAHGLDVTNVDSINAWVNYGKTHLGQIHGLVLNGGGPKPGYFHELDDAVWHSAYQLLLNSAVHLIRAVLPSFEQASSGSVLAVTSSAVKEPIPHLLLSNVFRSGVTALMKTMAEHYAAQGIRFNTIAPGRFSTARVDSLDESAAKHNNISIDEVRAKAVANIPMHRYGDPQEFARAATFLLSSAASYITGENLQVDGGLIRGY